MEQAGLKLSMPEQGTTITQGNRMIHPIGPLSADKKTRTTGTSDGATINTAQAPCTPIVYGVRSPA